MKKTPAENRLMVRQLAGVKDTRIPIIVVRLAMSSPYFHNDGCIHVGGAWLAPQGIPIEHMAKDGKPMIRERGNR